MANSMSQQSNPSVHRLRHRPASTTCSERSIDGGNPEVSFTWMAPQYQRNRNYGNQLPNPDALEEFRVETSTFAQYAICPPRCDAVTKSERTDCTALFEFNRNTDFNAYPERAKERQANLSMPYHRNQFALIAAQ